MSQQHQHHPLSDRQLKHIADLKANKHAMLEAKRTYIKECVTNNEYLHPICRSYEAHFEKHTGDNVRLKSALNALINSLRKMKTKGDAEHNFMQHQIQRAEALLKG